jgi:hypothetical protein
LCHARLADQMPGRLDEAAKKLVGSASSAESSFCFHSSQT